MQYFFRAHSANQGHIWNLFKDLPTVSGEKEVQSLEILRSAKTGAIDLSTDFNLKGYTYSISRREAQAAAKANSKLLSFQPSMNKDESSRPSRDGITEEDLNFFGGSVFRYKNNEVEGNFSDEFRQDLAISEVRSASNELAELIFFDLETCLGNVVKGFQPAVKMLKNILKEFPEYREVVLTYLREFGDL